MFLTLDTVLGSSQSPWFVSRVLRVRCPGVRCICQPASGDQHFGMKSGLVLQSASMGKGGETFILNMGQQVRILDLAEDLIRLSGLEPGKDIEITFTGVRQGEKLSEDLWEEGHQFDPTSHPEIFRQAIHDNLNNGPLDEIVNQLTELSEQGNPEDIVRILDEAIPGSTIRSTPPPEMGSII